MGCEKGVRTCPHCNFSTANNNDMQYHIAAKHGRTPHTEKYQCALCGERLKTAYQLAQHKQSEHRTSGRSRQEVENLDLGVYGDDPALQAELATVRHLLADSVSRGKKQNVYNFQLTSIDAAHTESKIQVILKDVLTDLPCAAKIHVSFGFVLRNVEDESFRYFYAEENNRVLQHPVLVQNGNDMDNLLAMMEELDFREHMTSHRPNTKWQFYCITNMTVFATLVLDTPLGCKDVEIPEQLSRHCELFTLTYDLVNKRSFNDNMCLFRAIVFHKKGADKRVSVENETKQLFNTYIQQLGIEANKFRGVKKANFPIVERLTDTNIFVYDVEITEEGRITGVLDRRSAGLQSDTVNLVQFGRHLCYIKDPQHFFNKYRCPTCDKIINHKGHYNVHLTSCDDRIKHKYPTTCYKLKDTIFEKLETLDIHVPKEHQLFKNLAVFDFESICVPLREEEMHNTDTTKWLGKHIPISVSLSSNLLQDPIFLCNSDPKQLVEEFVENLNTLSERNRHIMEERFKPLLDHLLSLEKAYQLETSKRKSNNPTEPKDDDMFTEEEEDSLEDFIEGDNTVGDSDDIQCIEPAAIDLSSSSTQLLTREHKNLQSVIKELRDYLTTLPVFGFNSSRYDLNLIKEYLIPILMNKDLQPQPIKSINKFISLKYDGIQFLDIMNFLGGSTSLDSFLKAFGASETKAFFPYEWFNDPSKLDDTILPEYDAFFSKLKNHNVLEHEHNTFTKLLNSGFTVEKAIKKLKLGGIPNTGPENYAMLQNIWQTHGMTTFKDFVRWYNNKDVVPTLEALQKMVDFYHSKGLDMLKLGCTLPNLSNIILHKSTKEKFFPFQQKDSDLHDKLRQEMTGGPSIIFTREAKVDETYIRTSANKTKAIVGIDASQLYPYSMCRDMPTGMYTRWEKTEQGKFKPHYNKQQRFEQIVMRYAQEVNPECNIQSIHTTGDQKRIGPYSVDGFCAHCNTIYEAMGCYFHFCPDCQECKTNLSEADIERGQKRRLHDEERAKFLREKGYKIEEVWECNWWKLVKTVPALKEFMKQHFPFQQPITEEELVRRIQKDQLFGYVQCDLEVPEHMREEFANFPPIFKNTLVSRADIGDHMRQYAEENDLLKKPRKMLISSYFLKDGIVTTPNLQFYLSLGLKCSNITRFVQYQPKKCFKKFVDDVVEARRNGDKNKESTVVAETMKLIGNSSYGYQIMDRSKHTNTRYTNSTKADRLINNKRFMNLNAVTDDVYEIQTCKTTIDHREPIVVGFFILQYAKLRMLELYYNFFKPLCDVNMYEEIEMDTDSLYLAIGSVDLEDCIKEECRQLWSDMRANDCDDNFEANPTTNFFPRTCCEKHAQHDKREPGLFKEEFRCTEMIALCSKTYICYDSHTKTTKLSSKGLNKNTLLEGEPMAKYRKTLEEQESTTSVNHGFRVVDSKNVQTYEQTKRGLSYLYGKRKVRDDGRHTDPLDL